MGEEPLDTQRSIKDLFDSVRLALTHVVNTGGKSKSRRGDDSGYVVKDEASV